MEPGLAHDLAGNTNEAGILPIKYRPRNRQLDTVYDVTAATVVSTAGASFSVGLGVSGLSGNLALGAPGLGGISGLLMIW